jgi:NAD(P)-dependent dehydrogenase (short-subunit alcohol dehydrogenase family)
VRKAVVITGGSRGIGRACAVRAASKGWSVVIGYLGDDGAAVSAVDAVRSHGGQAIAVRGDVALEADVARLFDEAQGAFGALGGVVVNAGVVAPAAPLADMSAERLRRLFEINVLGAYLTAREAARRLAKDRGGPGGSIVIVSSAAARLGSPFEYVDYAGSKAALDTLTIGLSKELGGQGVRVNAVRPGLIETEIHASGGQPDRAQRLGAATPMGRAGTAEEVAEAVLWLLDDAASYVTGAILDVTGGR